MVKALRHCTSLTTLRARCLDAPVATVSRLISLLGVCHRLSVLDIGENALPDHMVPPSNWIPSLAKVLPYSQVATVDISSCRVTDECVGALATAIAESNLTSLDMSDNGIGSVGARDLTAVVGGQRSAFVCDLRYVGLDMLLRCALTASLWTLQHSKPELQCIDRGRRPSTGGCCGEKSTLPARVHRYGRRIREGGGHPASAAHPVSGVRAAVARTHQLPRHCQRLAVRRHMRVASP